MVRLFVAVTDKSWFDQLSASAPHDEVNFWQPSGTTQFRALQPGELFLFKLHAPNNFIDKPREQAERMAAPAQAGK